ncbi:hypothetical protein MYAM1_001619 [Malassezia yamatoensis]|uniref:Inner centromere protein ARK-binding domain-containing protein n=1 Tax=Malassezia yamatoensis TaxID=253288 RepID=A0AAJ5YUF9_9BASI|nr:hypothetical protein MYAM1_001619 [Malassezia yamatoensis]
MRLRKKAAGRSAAAHRKSANMKAQETENVHATRHRQVLLNAYIIAQSQLLQLAKQMEFDADISIWENDTEEKMQEFWQQTRENVDEFCSRMQYVISFANSSSDQRDAVLPQIVADVIKSPRKKPVQNLASPSKAMVTEHSPSSPTQKRMPTQLASSADSSRLEDEVPSSLPGRSLSKRSSSVDQLLAPLSGQIEELPSRQHESSGLAPTATHSKASLKSPERATGLPSTTPGTGLRTKRTLSKAVLRSTKKLTDLESASRSSTSAAVPVVSSSVPQGSSAKPAASRFRSSFLNKSLRKAIEERQERGGWHNDDSEHEPSPFDDSREEPMRGTPTLFEHAQTKEALENPSNWQSSVSTSPLRNPAPMSSATGPLDALRTRLENVRRVSAASVSYTTALLPHWTAEQRGGSTRQPTDEMESKAAHNAATPSQSSQDSKPTPQESQILDEIDTPQDPSHGLQNSTAGNVSDGAPNDPTNSSKTTINKDSHSYSSSLSTSVSETMERATTPSPSDLSAPRQPLLTPPPTSQTPSCKTNASPSRLPLATRSPSRLDRSPSRADRPPSRLNRSQSRADGPRPMSRAQMERESVSREAQPGLASSQEKYSAGRFVQNPRSPSRLATRVSGMPASPSRLDRGLGPFQQPIHASPFRAQASQALHTGATRPGSPGASTLRSPSRIGPNSAATPSKKQTGSQRGPYHPPRSPTQAMPPVRPASPKLTVHASAVERDASSSTIGSRIKSLLGFQAQASRTVPISPQSTRPMKALARTSPNRPDHQAVSRPGSPTRGAHTALGFHDRISNLDHDLQADDSAMPGAFTDSRRTADTTNAQKPIQRKVLAPIRPMHKPSANSRPSVQVRVGNSTAIRPGSRAVPGASRVSQAHASTKPRSVSIAPAHAKDSESKPRKVSQQPLSEVSNYDDRVSTESALKNKLTTSTNISQLGSATGRSSGTLRTSMRPTEKQSGMQRPGAIGHANVFQQKPIASEPQHEEQEQELMEVQSEYSDSEDEASIKKRKLEPSWTRGHELEDLLLQQSTVDPDEIFGFQMGPVPLDTMLPPTKGDRRRGRKRTSSANWNGPDGLAQWEIDRYNERMGIQSYAKNAR